MTVKLKLEGQESSPTSEVCTDCRYYKRILTVENEEQHYCISVPRVGGDMGSFMYGPRPNAALRMNHLAAVCDFYAKDASKEFTERTAPDREKAYHLLDIPNPKNNDEIIYIGLTPGEYREYQSTCGPFGMGGGTIPASALKRRGLDKRYTPEKLDRSSPFKQLGE
jgi:hypothetical protein